MIHTLSERAIKASCVATVGTLPVLTLCLFACLGCMQVRMAQGPDGGGFKVGHRASKSLYANKTATEPTTTDETVSEETLADGVAADVTIAANTTASEVDVTKTVVE